MDGLFALGLNWADPGLIGLTGAGSDLGAENVAINATNPSAVVEKKGKT